MFTIDTHTHIIPKEIPDYSRQFGTGNYITLDHHAKDRAWMMNGNTKFREIVANCWDPVIRIKEMAEHKIDMQVICTIPVMFNYDKDPAHCAIVSRFLNDDIAATVHAHPGKFIGLATVPMQDTALAVEELKRCMQLGFRGVQIGSNVNNLNLGEPQFDAFFRACEELGAAVLIHPWQMMGQEHMQKYWLPWLVGMPAEISRAACSMIFSGVFEKYPSIKICFAHGGGSFLPTISRIEHGWECRPDLVATDNKKNPKSYLGKFWVDSHVCDHRMLTYVAELIGTGRIMQGSDYPFPLGEAVPGDLVRSAPFNDRDKSAMLGQNAREWLGLPGN